MRVVSESRRAQAAVDFLISYGIVILALAITVGLLYEIGINNSYTESPYCTPSPSFSCGYYSLAGDNGMLQVQLGQDTGTGITVDGVACAADENAIGDVPAEGNLHVTQNSLYYPPNAFAVNTLYSGTSDVYSVYCYDSGGVATGRLGSAFSGFVWLNYTIPGYGSQTEVVATINTKYT